ncbi:hypothetical protein X732_19460 [Mesorhizobium sp. L2C066B000]|nr:hypothetical protein X732_19460 [Mesorhizobium sp. L2C066B000]
MGAFAVSPPDEVDMNQILFRGDGAGVLNRSRAWAKFGLTAAKSAATIPATCRRT